MKSLNVTKGSFKHVNGRTPDKTMTRRNVTKKIIIGKTLHRKLTIEQKERNRNGTKTEIKRKTKQAFERMCPRRVSSSSSINGIRRVTLVKNPAEIHELGEAGIVITTRVIVIIIICRTELIHDLSIAVGS